MKGEAAYKFLERNPLNKSLVFWAELRHFYPCSVYDNSIKIKHFEFRNENKDIKIYQYSFDKIHNKWFLEKQYSKKQFCDIFKNTEFDKRYYLISDFLK